MKSQIQYVLTANDLLLGDVIYLDKSNSWTRFLTCAKVFESKEEAEAALAEASIDTNLIGPYLATIDEQNGEPVANHFREEFRATGPSNYFHGKQELTHV